MEVTMYSCTLYAAFIYLTNLAKVEFAIVKLVVVTFDDIDRQRTTQHCYHGAFVFGVLKTSRVHLKQEFIDFFLKKL